MILQKENHLYGTSGGDTHEQHESNIGKAGMAFPYRIKTEKELANALFRHDGRCIINGVIQPAEPPKPSFIISLSERNPHMESLKELYRIGTGPSSSHTMGRSAPRTALKKKYPQADRFFVTLYGSLAKTGKGHLTDDILVKTFAPLPVEIRFDLSDKPLPPPEYAGAHRH